MTTADTLLSELREVLQSDISNKKLAAMTEVNYASISQLRSGKKELEGLQLETARRLLRAKNVL